VKVSIVNCKVDWFHKKTSANSEVTLNIRLSRRSPSFKTIAKIIVSKFGISLELLIADITDDCILEIDFLKKVNLLEMFESEFDNKAHQNYETLVCSQIISEGKVPEFLRELFQPSSEKLNDI